MAQPSAKTSISIRLFFTELKQMLTCLTQCEMVCTEIPVRFSGQNVLKGFFFYLLKFTLVMQNQFTTKVIFMP